METPLSAPMDPQQFAAMLTKINAKLGTLTSIKERLPKIEATSDQTPPQNNHRDNTDNPPNLDDQLLKSIKIDVPTFDGRHDPQLFQDWILPTR